MLSVIGLGGTFDHLHEGHEYLLKTALSISKKICIGLTSLEMLKNKNFASKIESYETRKKGLEQFIQSFTDINRVQIIELKDPYGPPIHDPNYDGLIVSQETYEGGRKINEIREEKGFSPLILIVIPLLKNKNNQKISSTLIREKL